MKQNEYSPSQLKSLILKYQQEMLSSYQRKSIPDTEQPAVNTGAFIPQAAAPPQPYPVQPNASSPRSENGFYPTAPYLLNPKEHIHAAPVPGAGAVMQPATVPGNIGFAPPPTPQSGMMHEDMNAGEAAFPNNMMPDFKDDEYPSPPSFFRPYETAENYMGLVHSAKAEPSAQSAAGNVLSDYGDDAFSASPSMYWPDTIQTNSDMSGAEVGIPADPSLAPAITTVYDFVDGECPPSPSMMRPSGSVREMILETMSPPDTTGAASLQIRVTCARNTIPVTGARVLVSRAGVSTQKAQKSGQTDSCGNTPIFVLPACNPPAPCTIEVSANGFCSAHYSGVPLYNGMTATQSVDLIPLPTGQKSDIMILYDEPPVK